MVDAPGGGHEIVGSYTLQSPGWTSTRQNGGKASLTSDECPDDVDELEQSGMRIWQVTWRGLTAAIGEAVSSIRGVSELRTRQDHVLEHWKVRPSKTTQTRINQDLNNLTVCYRGLGLAPQRWRWRSWLAPAAHFSFFLEMQEASREGRQWQRRQDETRGGEKAASEEGVLVTMPTDPFATSFSCGSRGTLSRVWGKTWVSLVRKCIWSRLLAVYCLLLASKGVVESISCPTGYDIGIWKLSYQRLHNMKVSCQLVPYCKTSVFIVITPSPLGRPFYITLSHLERTERIPG